MELANQPLDINDKIKSSIDENGKYAGPSARCVLFNLESEIYGIQVKKIREVLRVSNIRDVAGSGPHVLGVINVRGVIVTVMDARIMFGMPHHECTDFSRIIIVEVDDDHTVGILVDSVMEVKDIPENCIEPLSATKENASRNIQAIAHYEDNVIILIDVDNMFMG